MILLTYWLPFFKCRWHWKIWALPLHFSLWLFSWAFSLNFLPGISRAKVSTGAVKSFFAYFLEKLDSHTGIRMKGMHDTFENWILRDAKIREYSNSKKTNQIKSIVICMSDWEIEKTEMCWLRRAKKLSIVSFYMPRLFSLNNTS